MKNIEKYEEEIKKEIANFRDIPCIVKDLKDGGCGESRNCVTCSTEMLHWLSQEYKEPILNAKEKKYLGMLIKPFRDRVMAIKKSRPYDYQAFIMIEVRPADNTHPQTIVLPSFDARSGMYNGMMGNKKYTLEELGL